MQTRTQHNTCCFFKCNGAETDIYSVCKLRHPVLCTCITSNYAIHQINVPLNYSIFYASTVQRNNCLNKENRKTFLKFGKLRNLTRLIN